MMHHIISALLFWIVLNSNVVHGESFFQFSSLSAYFSGQRNGVEQLQKLGILPSPPECGIFREDQYFNLEQSAESNEFPWVATLIHLQTKLEFLGVLISKRYLLARVYSFDEFKNQLNTYLIYMGSCHSKGNCSQAYEVEYIEKDRQKDYYWSFGISLLRLNESIDRFTDDVRPICLPDTNELNKNYVGQHLLWTGHQYLKVRRFKRFVLIQPLKNCHRAWDRLDSELDENVICANTCEYDTYYSTCSILMGVAWNNYITDHYYLAGLQNDPGYTCIPGRTNTFERIDKLLNWIAETIAKAEYVSIRKR